MTYRAFITIEKDVPFREVYKLFDELRRTGIVEQGLISQSQAKKYRVHEYNFNDGPLVQLVGTMNNDASSMYQSEFSNYRVLGSDTEIDDFVEFHDRTSPWKLREARVLLSTEIGTLTKEDLERIFQSGAVIKHEYGLPQIIDTTDLM